MEGMRLKMGMLLRAVESISQPVFLPIDEERHDEKISCVHNPAHPGWFSITVTSNCP
jgi:hypothetical protein